MTEPSIKPALSPEEERYLHGYSWGALVYSTAYFGAMRDYTFATASVIAALTIILLPAYLVMPAYARRRAWNTRAWTSFAEFKANQQSWDRAAAIGSILSVILLVALVAVMLRILENALYQGGITIDPNGNAVDQINNARGQLNALEQ